MEQSTLVQIIEEQTNRALWELRKEIEGYLADIEMKLQIYISNLME